MRWDGAKLPLNFTSAVIYAALPVAWLAIFFNDPKNSFAKYGLQVSKWSEQYDKLITHFLVHGSEMHVIGTVIGFLSSTGVWLAIQSQSAIAMPTTDAFAAVSAAIVSGVVGGVGATLAGLYVERLKFVREHKWGYSFLDDLVTKSFRTLRENRVVVCGGSAVVNGLAGFVFGTHDHYFNLALTIALDCIALGVSFTQTTSWSSLLGFGGQAATNTTSVGSIASAVSGGGGSGAGSTGIFSGWFGGDSGSGSGSLDGGLLTSSDGNTQFAIGHAAHIGGALVGFALGQMYKEYRYQCYLRSLRPSRHRLGDGDRDRDRGSERRRSAGGSIRMGTARSGRRLGDWSQTYNGQEHPFNADSHATRQRSRSAEMGGNPFRSAEEGGSDADSDETIAHPLRRPYGIGNGSSRAISELDERSFANTPRDNSPDDNNAADYAHRTVLGGSIGGGLGLSSSLFAVPEGAATVYLPNDEARRLRRREMGGDPFIEGSQSPR